jgi:plasmid maintenance system antidote protein VapI
MAMAHPLAAWIDARMSRAAFADKVGASQSHLALLLQGKRGISLELAVQIEKTTAGEFTAARLLKVQKAMEASL